MKMIGARPAGPSEVKACNTFRIPVGIVLGDAREIGAARDDRQRATSADVDIGIAVQIRVVEEQLAHVIRHDVEHDLEAEIVRART